MYRVEVVTPPAAGPVTAAELRGWLRLNDDSEDTTLTELAAAAVERFEQDARRPVLATGYRQWFDRLPAWPLVLMRGGVTAVTGVKARADDGTLTALTSGTQWRGLVAPTPAQVRVLDWPGSGNDLAGCVEFTAGWADAGAVPKAVRVGLRLLAAHWYERREAFGTESLTEVPAGWAAIVAPYRLGLSGDWGM